MTDKSFELTPETVQEYLAAEGLVPRGEPCKARELGGGVSNIVLLIEWPQTPARRWVVKQSLEKLRVKDDWRSERSRIFREAQAIRLLRPLVANALPEVIHVDREKYLYVMTASPPGSLVWKDSLLAGHRPSPQTASQAGTLLATMINGSRAPELREHLEEEFRDRTVFDQLRIDPYYRTAAARHPDVASALAELIQDSWQIRTSIVHGDYSPKNILVTRGEIFLIDFEVVHWGDPAFDAAFLLNHLLLKAFHQPRFLPMYVEDIREFWKALSAGLGPERVSDFEGMTLRHLGGLMLARIDGKSPVEYIRDEGTRERVRSVAKHTILQRLCLEEVVKLTAL